MYVVLTWKLVGVDRQATTEAQEANKLARQAITAAENANRLAQEAVSNDTASTPWRPRTSRTRLCLPS